MGKGWQQIQCQQRAWRALVWPKKSSRPGTALCHTSPKIDKYRNIVQVNSGTEINLFNTDIKSTLTLNGKRKSKFLTAKHYLEWVETVFWLKGEGYWERIWINVVKWTFSYSDRSAQFGFLASLRLKHRPYISCFYFFGQPCMRAVLFVQNKIMIYYVNAPPEFGKMVLAPGLDAICNTLILNI